MAKFEKVSRMADVDFEMPRRKTAQSAGYDMVVAEDVTIYPAFELIQKMADTYDRKVYSLEEIAAMTKSIQAKPTLVSTGVKCKMDGDTYLELSVRSSCPLKHWLMLANSVGIIDADYYNNSDNEGEIFFQFINLSPFPIRLKRGEAIGQGIIKPYIKTEDDTASGLREGAFCSTDSAAQSTLAPAT